MSVAGRPHADSGQMTVELAVIAPVVIVVALTIYNLGRFVQLCAAFDHVSLDQVVYQGVSPPGDQTSLAGAEAIRTSIAQSLPGDDFDVAVACEGSPTVEGSTFSLAPWLCRYSCTLEYRPWPRSFVIAGVPFEAPLKLRHVRTLVVDRYKSGVVF